MPRLFAPKTKKKDGGGGLSSIFWWLFSLSANIWLFWIILNPSQKGLFGDFIFSGLKNFFGLSVYILPFLTLYGIIALLLKLGKPNKGFITLIFAIASILTAISSIAEFVKIKTANDFFNGGWIGYAAESLLAKIFGSAGALIFSLAFLLLGIQIAFRISWVKFISDFWEKIKIDYKQWSVARDELAARTKILKEKKQKKEKVYDIKPVDTPGSAPVIQTDNSTQIEKNKEPQKNYHNEPAVFSVFKNEKQPAPIKSEPKVKKSSEYDMFKNFKLPEISLLNPPDKNAVSGPEQEEMQQAKTKLEETLRNFEIEAYVSGVYPGPVITRYEVTPSPGVKISSIVSLSNDIALAMRAQGIRVIAPIPGKAAIGFEIPNAKRAKVCLREILESSKFNSSSGKLVFALGKHADGSPATANLETMPHLLVAGATGSGKSVFLQSLILSIIYRNTPDEVKFLFIDPKRLELTFYEGIPYLYDPKVTPDKVEVITDAKEAAKSLVALTRLMDSRYKKFERARVKNISSYNKWAEQNNQPKEFYIVVVIDELADLMLQAKNVVEENIQRLAQMARAVGIHLVLATQRPSVDVITGVIKANLPSRVALQVSSKIDSRVIIDMPGAESLIGRGDMLYLGIDLQKPERIQGCYVGEDEIEKIAEFVKEQGAPNYPVENAAEEAQFDTGKGGSSEELTAALKLVQERKKVSQDLLKAHFGSSARATNILSILEVRGFIFKPEGTNRWQIFFDKIDDYLSKVESQKSEVKEQK
ncbi:MAG: DNA translocase FtsK [Elusimicrobia bacterium]|nr:DNA translocase FtsK [Elusimicrobiota bacterium]